MHRLENPGDKADKTISAQALAPVLDTESPHVAVVDYPEARDDAEGTSGDAGNDADAREAATESDPDSVVEGSKVVELNLPTRSNSDGEYVPLPGVSSTAQAEALRITLHAHEEAHRLRAEANGLRAEAAAEGERILVEARMLSDRLHVESRESATDLLAAAKNEANAIIDAARAEAERVLREAHEDSAAHRAELEAQAEQDREDAKAAVLAEAAREAERIRADALEAGRAEAARLVEAEVAAAAVEGRRAVESSRARAGELLDAANDSIDEVRTTMRRVIDSLGESLVAFNSSVGSVEVLRDTIGELAPAPAEGQDDDEDGTGRRPLGLLFGAPRG